MNTRIALFLAYAAAAAIPSCVASSSCPAPSDAGPTADVELPKPISVFIACDTFDDFVARNAERLGCGSELPECPWPRELDVRCDGAGVLETLAVVRDSVTECGNVLAVVDGAVCH